jgi:hypothetical protein
MPNAIFYKKIKTGEIEREFLFQQTIYSDNILWYHIDVKDDDGTQINFRMYKDEKGQWKISAQVLPLWIHENELQFNDVVQENLLGN